MKEMIVDMELRKKTFEEICKEANKEDIGARVDFVDHGYLVLFIIDHTYGELFEKVCNKILEKVQKYEGTKINRVTNDWFGGIEAYVEYGWKEVA